MKLFIVLNKSVKNCIQSVHEIMSYKFYNLGYYRTCKRYAFFYVYETYSTEEVEKKNCLENPGSKEQQGIAERVKLDFILFIILLAFSENSHVA